MKKNVDDIVVIEYKYKTMSGIPYRMIRVRRKQHGLWYWCKVYLHSWWRFVRYFTVGGGS